MSQVNKILAILKDNPDNYSLAAEKLNISRKEVIDLLDSDPEIKKSQSDSYLDELTSQYKLYIVGKCKIEDFNANHALKLLERERPEIWAARIDERGKASAHKQEKGRPKKAFLEAVDSSFSAKLKEDQQELSSSVRFPIPLSDIYISQEDLNELGSMPNDHPNTSAPDLSSIDMPEEESISFEDDDLFELEEII